MSLSWKSPPSLWIAGVAALLCAVVALVHSRPAPGAHMALPDSPLYVLAAEESVRTLAGERAEPAPPQPCPDCGQIHARPHVAAANLARSAAIPTTRWFYCANCRYYHPVESQQPMPRFRAP